MGRSRRRFDSRAEWARKGVSKQLHVFALKRDGFLFGRTSSSRLGPTEMHQDPLTSPRIRVSRRFFLSREILDGKVNLSIVERGCHCCCVNNNKVFILDRVEFRDFSSRHFTGIRFLCLKFISSIRSIKKHDEKKVIRGWILIWMGRMILVVNHDIIEKSVPRIFLNG